MESRPDGGREARPSAAPAASPSQDFVLVDFDGTLAAADVGNLFFQRFTRDQEAWLRWIDLWKQGRLSARECLARESELARVSRDQALAFVDEFDLVPEAAAFLSLARARGHHVVVASDGLDFYVDRLLARAGVEVERSANRLLFFDDATVAPVYASSGPEVTCGRRVARPRSDAPEGCGACGNCKGAILGQARSSMRFRRLLLVGDGLSDRCAARVADRVYAKDDLLEFCRARGIAARPFATLDDVARAEQWVSGSPREAPGFAGSPAETI